MYTKGMSQFKTTPGVFGDLAEKARIEEIQAEKVKRIAKQYVFIIDEINRGHVNSIFGEGSFRPSYKAGLWAAVGGVDFRTLVRANPS